MRVQEGMGEGGTRKEGQPYRLTLSSQGFFFSLFRASMGHEKPIKGQQRGKDEERWDSWGGKKVEVWGMEGQTLTIEEKVV